MQHFRSNKIYKANHIFPLFKVKSTKIQTSDKVKLKK